MRNRLSVIDAWIGKILEKIDLDKNTMFVIIGDHGAYIQSLKNKSLEIDFQDNANLQNEYRKSIKKNTKICGASKTKIIFNA